MTGNESKRDAYIKVLEENLNEIKTELDSIEWHSFQLDNIQSVSKVQGKIDWLIDNFKNLK